MEAQFCGFRINYQSLIIKFNNRNAIFIESFNAFEKLNAWETS